jgi:hypothetical protein
MRHLISAVVGSEEQDVVAAASFVGGGRTESPDGKPTACSVRGALGGERYVKRAGDHKREMRDEATLNCGRGPEQI